MKKKNHPLTILMKQFEIIAGICSCNRLRVHKTLFYIRLERISTTHNVKKAPLNCILVCYSAYRCSQSAAMCLMYGPKFR